MYNFCRSPFWIWIFLYLVSSSLHRFSPCLWLKEVNLRHIKHSSCITIFSKSFVILFSTLDGSGSTCNGCGHTGWTLDYLGGWPGDVCDGRGCRRGVLGSLIDRTLGLLVWRTGWPWTYGTPSRTPDRVGPGRRWWKMWTYRVGTRFLTVWVPFGYSHGCTW